jgi:hypothetical protein
MPIALGEAGQGHGIEPQWLRRINRVQAILLIDRNAPGDAPLALAANEAVIEAAVAGHIDGGVSDLGANEQDHACFGDGAIAVDVDRRRADEVLRTGACPCFLDRAVDELVRRAREPRRVHRCVRGIQRAQPVPSAGIPPQAPVVDRARDRRAIDEILERIGFQRRGIRHCRCPR